MAEKEVRVARPPAQGRREHQELEGPGGLSPAALGSPALRHRDTGFLAPEL